MTPLGTLRADGDRRAIHFERYYDAPPPEVWALLTEPAALARWLAPAAIANGAVRIDFEGGAVVTGAVLTWEPPHVLEYEWRFAGEEESVVRFELSPDGDGTLLVLDHRRLGVDQATGYGAGWHAYLDALGDELCGGSGSWGERFAALLPRYRELAAAL
ncbi:MAG: SRPBCC family protein [Gaiellaceae bacterium]